MPGPVLEDLGGPAGGPLLPPSDRMGMPVSPLVSPLCGVAHGCRHAAWLPPSLSQGPGYAGPLVRGLPKSLARLPGGQAGRPRQAWAADCRGPRRCRGRAAGSSMWTPEPLALSGSSPEAAADLGEG